MSNSNNVLILSTCISVSDTMELATFHYNGFYQGEKVTRIMINCSGHKTPKRGNNYMIRINEPFIVGNCLGGKMIKIEEVE